jgi:hypothetical protein
MTEAEVKRIAREAAECAVKATFGALGVDISKDAAKIEVQKDFAFLRGRRLLELNIRVKVIIVFFSLLLAGLISVIAAAWVIVTGRGT